MFPADLFTMALVLWWCYNGALNNFFNNFLCGGGKARSPLEVPACSEDEAVSPDAQRTRRLQGVVLLNRLLDAARERRTSHSPRDGESRTLVGNAFEPHDLGINSQGDSNLPREPAGDFAGGRSNLSEEEEAVWNGLEALAGETLRPLTPGQVKHLSAAVEEALRRIGGEREANHNNSILMHHTEQDTDNNDAQSSDPQFTIFALLLYKEAQAEEKSRAAEGEIEAENVLKVGPREVPETEQEASRLQKVQMKVMKVEKEEEGTEEKAKVEDVEKSGGSNKPRAEKDRKGRTEKENKGKKTEKGKRQKADEHKKSSSSRPLLPPEDRVPPSGASLTSSGHQRAERFYTLGQYAGARFCNQAPPLSALPKMESFSHWLPAQADAALTNMSDRLKSMLKVEGAGNGGAAAPPQRQGRNDDGDTAARAMADHLKFLLKVDDKKQTR